MTDRVVVCIVFNVFVATVEIINLEVVLDKSCCRPHSVPSTRQKVKMKIQTVI